MTMSLFARGWIVAFAALGSAVTAKPVAQDGVVLPNAADPKPTAPGSQGTGQMVIISLERSAQGASASGAQAQRTNEPANKASVAPAPFHKPKGN